MAIGISSSYNEPESFSVLMSEASKQIEKDFYLIPKGKVEDILFEFDGMESGKDVIERLLKVSRSKV